MTYSPEPVRISESGHDVSAEIAGDFPGSPVTLRFHFEFNDEGLITVLRIRP